MRNEPRILADEVSARGAHRLLTEEMIPYHMYTEDAFLAHLDKVRVAILPDQRHLSTEMVAALEAWVEAGGVLIATGLTGTLDDALNPTGEMALGKLCGVRYMGTYEQTHAYLAITDPGLKAGLLDMPHLVEAVTALVELVAEDVQVLADLYGIYLRSDGKLLLRWSPVGEPLGHPAITLRAVGRGYACYIANDIFHAYQVKNQWVLKPLVSNLLHKMVADPLVQVTAPAWVEVTLMHQSAADAPRSRARTLVHLVNQHGDRAVDGNGRCSEVILPVKDIQVALRLEERPTRVTLEPDGAFAQWVYAEGVLTVQVPQVHIHRVIAIEF